jgi:hypothetical protein
MVYEIVDVDENRHECLARMSWECLDWEHADLFALFDRCRYTFGFGHAGIHTQRLPALQPTFPSTL